MIKSFRHKGLQAFYESGSKAWIQPDHAAKIARLLARLDNAQTPGDMNVPGWKLHPLHGTLQGHFAVWVSGNWRLVFAFEDGDAILVDYVDYH
ncbi:peptidase [Acidithiobacillus ferridurans]|uniref:type II toxin-antitoxin system RelE/ParE family toxin n=1 Tax=Acidithiobacillus ferridurans TaxID=1232575 RepID=UPI000DE2D19C|nr:type II toxin-antitoxin system RelE/ParE family toxin [Acidithiobacillus ferridurans]RBM03251.1 peptidase [Acidithiobacillus ferridurans]